MAIKHLGVLQGFFILMFKFAKSAFFFSCGTSLKPKSSFTSLKNDCCGMILVIFMQEKVIIKVNLYFDLVITLYSFDRYQ